MHLKSVWATVLAVSFVAVAFGTVNAAAVDRSSGDFWTYDVSLRIDFLTGIESFEINGTMTYSFVGIDSVTVNGTDYPVNVMRITGGASQSISFLDIEVSVAFGGNVYETRDKMALVKNDLFVWANTSIGSGPFQIVNRTEFEILTVYSPPLMTGFDPAKTAPGDAWSETIVTSTTTTLWTEGVMIGSPETSSASSSFDFTVDATRQSVTTPAGTFDCLKISATSLEGTVFYYWSDKANNFVKEDSYAPGSSTAFSTMTLRDYKTHAGTAMITFIAIGAIVLVAAIIVLALVVMRKKKAAASIPPPPSPPPAL